VNEHNANIVETHEGYLLLGVVMVQTHS
jgi:hypothetical protein